jgi:formate hydrogenlyase regulatory protein HycA
LAVPQNIKICREEGYHTDRIGTYAGDRQFMAFVTATLRRPVPADWQAHKRWYAVLHTFNREGEHLDTRAWFAGTTADGEELVVAAAQAKLDEFLGELNGRAFGDVVVGLFEVDVDGHTFGLVDASDPDEDHERIDLLPNDLAIFEPWDGSYET